MAVSATIVETTGDNVDRTSYTTGSFTPNTNKLNLIWVYSIAATAPNTPTVSGAGLTWVAVDNQIDNASLRKITLFRSLGPSPSTGSLTIDFAGQTQTGCAWSWVEYTNADTSGTNGSGAIVQSAKNLTAAGTATSLIVTLASFASTANATVGGFGIPLNTAATPVVGSGFTATGQRNQATPNLSIASEFNSGNDTTVDMTSGAASIPWVGIAVEIRSEVIMFDAATNSTFQATASSYNWSHTTSTGNNRYLIVGVSLLSVVGSNVTGITYNSVAMTFLGAVASVSGAVRAELWGLLAPTTGANSIAVTLSTGIISAACAISFTGVHQTSPTEALNSATATNIGAADATVDVTTVANNDWVVDQVATDDTAITVGAGQTQRNNVTGTGGSGADSTKGPKTPAGVVTMSWTNVGAAQTWSIVAIALRDINASSLSIGVKTLAAMGVG